MTIELEVHCLQFKEAVETESCGLRRREGQIASGAKSPLHREYGELLGMDCLQEKD